MGEVIFRTRKASCQSCKRKGKCKCKQKHSNVRTVASQDSNRPHQKDAVDSLMKTFMNHLRLKRSGDGRKESSRKNSVKDGKGGDVFPSSDDYDSEKPSQGELKENPTASPRPKKSSSREKNVQNVPPKSPASWRNKMELKNKWKKSKSQEKPQKPPVKPNPIVDVKHDECLQRTVFEEPSCIEMRPAEVKEQKVYKMKWKEPDGKSPENENEDNLKTCASSKPDISTPEQVNTAKKFLDLVKRNHLMENVLTPKQNTMMLNFFQNGMKQEEGLQMVLDLLDLAMNRTIDAVLFKADELDTPLDTDMRWFILNRHSTKVVILDTLLTYEKFLPCSWGGKSSGSRPSSTPTFPSIPTPSPDSPSPFMKMFASAIENDSSTSRGSEKVAASHSPSTDAVGRTSNGNTPNNRASSPGKKREKKTSGKPEKPAKQEKAEKGEGKLIFSTPPASPAKNRDRPSKGAPEKVVKKKTSTTTVTMNQEGKKQKEETHIRTFSAVPSNTTDGSTGRTSEKEKAGSPVVGDVPAPSIMCGTIVVPAGGVGGGSPCVSPIPSQPVHIQSCPVNRSAPEKGTPAQSTYYPV